MNIPLLEAREVICLPQMVPFSLQLYGGEMVGIQGPSGCGKSLFMRALSGLDHPTGTILFKGLPLTHLSLPTYRTEVMLLPQRPVLRPESLQADWDWVKGLKVYQGRSLAAPTWERLGKPSEFTTRSTGLLSGGEQQLAVLLRALALNPQILLLDEATSAMDPASTEQAESWIRQWLTPDRAAIWISHNPEQLRRVTTRIIPR